MEITTFVPSLVSAVLAAVFVNSAPPSLPVFNFTTNAVAEYPREGDCGAGRCDGVPVKPTAVPQITNRNEDMDDCPIRTQLRINGICQCPREYPKRDGGFCCAYDFDGLKNCICPHGYVFRRNTREVCHEVNMREYTIVVNGVSMCQDENLKTKDGGHCCILNDKRKRLCHCPKGKTYDHVANKCRKSCKIFF